ncbi:hypothetical protein FB451DRAFT_1393288 [Mycena latifolia]|nr:hypothetical protein FB451DRAFT_1393288 [Mycena latifolia]
MLHALHIRILEVSFEADVPLDEVPILRERPVDEDHWSRNENAGCSVLARSRRIPVAVTRPTTSEDVAKIVQCAVASAVKVQARSGGHSYGNYGIGGEDGAVVVDMMNFQQFTMDTSTWRPCDRPRNVPTGCTRRSGVWGPSRGSGRSLGPYLRGGDRERTITRASATQNPDILFAVKGAAASFGIVTESVFMTHPEPTNAKTHCADSENTPTSRQRSRTFTLDRKLASEVVIFELGMIISGTYFGTRDEYNALNFEQRLTQNATVRKKRYCLAEMEALKLVGGVSGPFYSKSLTFKATTLIPAAGIQALFDLNATAYAHRDAQFYMQTDTVTNAMPGVPFGAYAGYVECLPDGQQEYWGTNLPRLPNIKAAIDPGDVFHNPQSVRPVAANSIQPSATTTGGAAAPSTGGAEGRGAWGYWISAVLVVARGYELTGRI